MNYAIVPSGTLTYEDVTHIVEALVNTEGRRYPIPDRDHEDIAQDIRLECLRLLTHYDPTRIGPSPYKYFQTCIRNFLYNLRRGIWVPNNPPCARCPLWDKVGRKCTIEEVGCEKIVQYRANMARKANLKTPSLIDDDVLDNVHEQEIDSVLLDHSIIEALPPKLLPFYEKLKNGEKIPPRMKKNIREIVLIIINNA